MRKITLAPPAQRCYRQRHRTPRMKSFLRYGRQPNGETTFRLSSCLPHTDRVPSGNALVRNDENVSRGQSLPRAAPCRRCGANAFPGLRLSFIRPTRCHDSLLRVTSHNGEDHKSEVVKSPRIVKQYASDALPLPSTALTRPYPPWYRMRGGRFLPRICMSGEKNYVKIPS